MEPTQAPFKYRTLQVCAGIGLIAGMVMLAICILAMGGGHGSYAPFTACFAPLNLLKHFGGYGAVILAAVMLYPVYGLLLAVFKQRGLGLRAYILIALIHHLCISLDYSSFRADFSSDRFMRVLNAQGATAALSLLCVIYFGLHLAAIVFALRKRRAA